MECDNLLTNALETLFRVARQAGEPRLIETGDPRRKLLLSPDGQQQFIDLPAIVEPLVKRSAQRKFTASTLESFVGLVGRYVGSSSPAILARVEPEGGSLECWPHDASRLVRVEMELPVTAAADAVLRLLGAQGGAGVTQQTLVRALRGPLAGCVTDYDLLAAVRTIKIAKRTEQSSNVGHTESGFGRSLEMQASGAVALPETVSLRLKWLEDFENAVELSLAISLDLESGLFGFDVVGDGLAALTQVLRECLDRELSEVWPGWDEEATPELIWGQEEL